MSVKHVKQVSYISYKIFNYSVIMYIFLFKYYSMQ